MKQQIPPKAPDTGPIPKNASPQSTQGWTIRQKRRWKSLLAWLAKGAEHACPT